MCSPTRPAVKRGDHVSVVIATFMRRVVATRPPLIDRTRTGAQKQRESCQIPRFHMSNQADLPMRAMACVDEPAVERLCGAPAARLRVSRARRSERRPDRDKHVAARGACRPGGGADACSDGKLTPAPRLVERSAKRLCKDGASASERNGSRRSRQGGRGAAVQCPSG